VHFRDPIGFPTEGWLSIQLPAGEYRLHERSDIHYELRTSALEFSLFLRVTEVERLRASGKLVIEGIWP
jgi:hypothetical protein